jgi:hypothetical protein
MGGRRSWSVTGTDILRIADGKLAEYWANTPFRPSEAYRRGWLAARHDSNLTRHVALLLHWLQDQFF